MLELKTSFLEQRVNLIRVNGLAKLTGTKNGCTLSMLVDGGASHSFINMNVLPKQTFEQIENGSSGLDVVKREYSLEMATETRKISCFIGRFLIKIDKWIGEKLLVVSRDLSSEECILGRDFLKKNRVLVDHFSEKILIRLESGVPKACVNRVNCFVKQATNIEQYSEKLIYAKFGKMELNRNMIFESSTALNSRGVRFACSLHKVEKKTDRIVVSTLNATTDTVKLEPNEIVGYLEEAAVFEDYGEMFPEAKVEVEKQELALNRTELEPRETKCLRLIDGVLVVRSNGRSDRVVVPNHAVQYLLRIYNDYELSGHRSFEKIYEPMESNFFGFGMRKRTIEYLKQKI
ncbi:hypothetical protein BpHYR1_050398 [Brachionus plicatilis]|uniref:Uncharacterized protein n=1 Tax=Brachionus plicatilis TaxID=10195 RepID=A0A3M7SCJ3_BRAPC|nr:hypothetical protein BpHYR1_050398 [Brachionus plicatilis]